MDGITEILGEIIRRGLANKTPEECLALAEKLKKAGTEFICKTPEERAQRQADNYNATKYEPAYDPKLRESDENKSDEHYASVVDCGVCGNKTNIAVAVGDSLKLRECECRKKRDNIIRLERSGLLDLMAEYTFDNFQVNEEFQRRIKTPALEFINQTEKQNSPRKWFYIGGRVGCGKTHICTAIVGALIEKGMSAKYMMYRDEAVMLKGMVGTEEYSRRVEFLKNVEVLYIDDLFKTQNVTDGDKNLMFEVINARYNSRSKITVISSEKIIDEVIEADEGIGSRIYERSRDFITNVGADKAKNWRLEGIFK